MQTEWTRGRLFEGEAEGILTLEGELRTAAAATVQAAASATGGRLVLELKGVKALRVFDAWMVVALLGARSARHKQEGLRLLGAYPCLDQDKARGAVMAVLDAVNRVLERYLED